MLANIAARMSKSSALLRFVALLRGGATHPRSLSCIARRCGTINTEYKSHKITAGHLVRFHSSEKRICRTWTHCMRLAGPVSTKSTPNTKHVLKYSIPRPLLTLRVLNNL